MTCNSSKLKTKVMAGRLHICTIIIGVGVAAVTGVISTSLFLNQNY
jgi:hypothetical protein